MSIPADKFRIFRHSIVGSSVNHPLPRRLPPPPPGAVVNLILLSVTAMAYRHHNHESDTPPLGGISGSVTIRVWIVLLLADMLCVLWRLFHWFYDYYYYTVFFFGLRHCVYIIIWSFNVFAQYLFILLFLTDLLTYLSLVSPKQTSKNPNDFVNRPCVSMICAKLICIDRCKVTCCFRSTKR